MDSDSDEVNDGYMDGDSYEVNESDWEDVNNCYKYSDSF